MKTITEVLIVAKCIVNTMAGDVVEEIPFVLIVAKCIVNVKYWKCYSVIC